MKNDPISNPAMACVYRTAFAVSALVISSSFAHASDPPVPRGNVSVNVNPTTGYYSTSNTTLRLPDGVRATPSAGASTVTKYAGGMQQSIPTGITINAIKKTAPLPVVVRAKTPSLKTAAKGLLKGNLAGLVLGAGLQQLLNGVGALIDDGGKLNMPDDGPLGSVPPPSDYRYHETAQSNYSTNSTECKPSSSNYSVIGCYAMGTNSSGKMTYRTYECLSSYRAEPLTGTLLPAVNGGYGSCYYGGSAAPLKAMVPATPQFIDDSVDSSYVPDETDWKNLVPHLDLDDVEITWAPTLQGEPKTTTEYDADGNPHKIRETNIWYDFDIRDNPSPQPKLDLKKREETKTYEDGVLTGTTTTESTESAGSDDTPPPPESPIDCDLFPTACAWFDWTQEEPVEPDVDLSPLLQEVPIVSETYTITGGVAACPAPLVLDLSVFGSREVSYQPLCDLASTMKFLYLALMSFAAAVLLNRSVNRV